MLEAQRAVRRGVSLRASLWPVGVARAGRELHVLGVCRNYGVVVPVMISAVRRVERLGIAEMGMCR